jgi:hypothetical protein
MATIQQRQFEPLPVGQYRARIGAVVVEPGKFGGDQVKVRFDITQPGFENREVLGFASATFTPASKLYGWARAAFGKDIPKSYDLNTDHLLDKEVELVLVQRASEDGRVFNRIDSVLPKGGARVAAPAAAAVAAPPPAPAAAGNGGAQVLHQGGARQPLTAAGVRGVAPQQQPVGVATPGEPEGWPGWDDGDMAEPATAPAQYADMPF